MVEPLFQFAFGVALLLVSAEILVKSAEKLSRVIKLSPLVIGATLVSIGTTLPEFTVSTVAVIKKDPGLAFGNIIGSNIINILLIFAVAILAGRLRVGTHKTQRHALLLLTLTFLFVLLQNLSLPRPLLSLLLIAGALAFTLDELRRGLLGRKHEDAIRFLHQERIQRFEPYRLALLLAAPLGIILGGTSVVASVETLSLLTGLSTTVLGLSLTAVITSLPELLTAFFSQKDHQEKLTTGNLLGSNTYNLLFTGGIISLSTSARTVSTLEWVWLLFAAALFTLILRFYKGRVIPKFVGLILLCLTLLYFFTLPSQT